MKLKTTLIGALLPALALGDIRALQAQLPECALGCLIQGADEFGCQATDLTCQCTQLEEMTKVVAPCLVNVGGCGLEEISDTVGIVAQMCVEHFETNNMTISSSNTDTSSTSSETSNEDSTGDAGTIASVGIHLLGVTVILTAAGLL